MKLGLGSYAYAWAIGVAGYPPPAYPVSAFTLVQRAADFGLSLVQIADNLPLHTLTQAELKRLRADAARLSVSVEVGTRGIGYDHLLRYLEIAQFFGSPILRTVIDTADQQPEFKDIINILHVAMPRFEKAGVTLAIENHDRFSAETFRQIVKLVGSPALGICLDTVNSFGASEGPGVVVPALGAHVVNLHVKDYTIHRHRHMLGFEIEGTPAGAGMLEIPWLLDQLARLVPPDRNVNAILELWPSPESDTAATIAKEDTWVVESIAYLRQIIPD